MDRPSVPANVENWSDASKQSGIYYCYPAEYTDEHYVCSRCQQPAIFTAEAQRDAFEVHKVYIWQRRHLCEDCFATCCRLKREANEFQRRWKEERWELQRDPKELTQWMRVLEELALYTSHSDIAHLKMLKRLLVTDAK